MALSAIPFGFVVGAAIIDSAMPTWVALAGNSLIFAGAAQLALITLAGTVSWWTAVATAVVINSRHIMYSAALTPRFQGQPTWFRWAAPAIVIDQVFALVSARQELDANQFRRYLLSSGLLFLTVWHLAVFSGVWLGSAVPEEWHLEFAVPVMFTGLVIMGFQRVSAVVASVAGAGAAVLFLGLPNKTGLLVAAAIGVAAGYMADSREAAS